MPDIFKLLEEARKKNKYKVVSPHFYIKDMKNMIEAVWKYLTEPVQIYFEKGHPEAKLPIQSHNGDAGYDVFSVEDTDLGPGKTTTVSTGLLCGLPDNIFFYVTPRSGLSRNHSITILNSPGLVDPTYSRGELKLIVINHGKETFLIRKGSKIAQITFFRTLPVSLNWIEKVEKKTSRGSDGFGSTGY